MTILDIEACKNVLDEVLRERQLEHLYYGDRHLPDGTSEFYQSEFHKADENVVQQHEQGTLTWRDLMMRAATSATCETATDDLRHELVELASLVIEWIEAIDRREGVA